MKTEASQRMKNVRQLLLGRSISLMGSGIYTICLPLYILKISGSLTQMGFFYALTALPAVAFTIPLGIFVERRNHKKILIICDVVSGTLFLFMALLSMNHRLEMLWMYAFGMILGVIDRIFYLSSSVLFSELNTSDTLEKMNGLKSICDNTASVCAPMVGTMLFGAFGFTMVLLINAFSFLLSSLQEMLIEYPRIQSTEKSDKVRNQLKEGIHYVIHAKHILAMFLLVMSLNFFVAPSEEIYYPGILIQLHHLPEAWYGFTSGCFVIGTLLAGILVYRIKNMNLERYMKELFLANSSVMAFMGLLSLIIPSDWKLLFYPVFLILMMIEGMLNAFVNIPLISGFQRDVDISMQARFFSLLTFCSNLLIPIGIAYAGILSEWLRPDGAFIVQNLMVILLVMIVYYLKDKGSKKLEKS